MAPDWTLKVEDFGRIAEAEVTVKPLTVLVGRNNSGKSYLATLIWGLHHGQLRASDEHAETIDALISGWLDRAIANIGQWTPWTSDEQSALRRAWPKVVDGSIGDFCRRLFDADGIRPATIEIGAPGLGLPWHAKYVQSKGGHNVEFAVLDRDGKSALAEALGMGIQWVRDPSPPWAALMMPTLTAHSSGHLRSGYFPVDPVYLPASRTGFSLFLATFIEARLSSSLTQQRPAPDGDGRFTLPHVHLLQGLASGFQQRPGPFADEAARLERECLDGTIVVIAPFGVANYRFQPDGMGDTIGLQHTSALVTELLPLIVALRYAQQIPFLVLEEPEAHLHPKLQRAVTRCLARLVRRGVKVLITTHSETVAQQVNNLIKLDSLDPEQRRHFGYDDEEYLAADEVAVHEFAFREDGRTVVEAVPPGPAGFAMATFNEPLLRFAEETLALNALLEGNTPEEAG